MVNQEERRKRAEQLRHFAAGLITNDDLCYHFEVLTGDRTLDYISGVVLLSFEMGGPYHLKYPQRNNREELCRTITFLYTDREMDLHELPLWRGIVKLLGLPLLLTAVPFVLLYKLIRSLLRKKEQEPDFWPFANSEDYEEALKYPKLLCGEKAA